MTLSTIHGYMSHCKSDILQMMVEVNTEYHNMLTNKY